ncbi:MAG TPA: NAD(P)/FAD-dependent oxidoreductase [Lacipirellulaceae bacterium]|nr:NAD(P)/FAD-dependent oxidoreductase [Lacipirellulaceae bacterium]
MVVGAGAAGLLAATRSAERGRRTLLLEKNRKPGVKILMSGGTRCNITHDCDAVGIIAAFGSAGRFLHSPLAALGPRELVDLLHAEGLSTKTEPGGKIFPQSDRAADVLNALLRRLHRSGAELALGEPVNAVIRQHDAFRIETSRRTVECQKLIVTTGGKSYPGCGTTGDGYGWLARLGHTIRRPRPALVPLTSDGRWLHELAGITVPDVLLTVIDPATAESSRRKRTRSGRPPGVMIERRGSLLFTHFGLSGPVALDVSRAVTAAANPRELLLVADFLPDSSTEALNGMLGGGSTTDGKRIVASVIAEKLPRRLVDSLLFPAEVPPDCRMAELSKVERVKVVDQLKRCEIRVTGSRGFDKAEVTAGGIALNEVDSRTMESKLVPNLYIAGEILDLDGFIGGYNFQAAFSTGWLAGESV